VAFQCRNLARQYRKGGFRLGDISLELRLGEITAVVGKNASGKTTFLRMVIGDLLPTSGQLSYPMLQPEKQSWLAIKEQIAFVPQLPDRWHGRLRHNLNFVAATYGVKGRKNRELVDWNVMRYGLYQYEDATWDEVSGGYKIRFELVRALVSQPKILVLDEPLAYLDVVTRQRFLSDLRSIASSLENPVPILITSQNLYEIEAIADQLVILDEGKCVFAGHMSELSKSADTVCIEVSLRAQKPQVAEALSDLGVLDVEETVEGFLLVLPAGTDHVRVFSTLHGRFGGAFYAYRDVTGSARSRMRENPALRAALAGPAAEPAENAA
jgi:ABC-type multidrug transport system ATPase subunit